MMSTDHNEQEIVNNHPHGANHTQTSHQGHADHTYTNHASHARHTSKKNTFKPLWEFLEDMEKLGDEYLIEKAPFTLPADITAFIVKAAPYITIISLIITLPVLIALLGFGTVFSVVMPATGIIVILTMILTAIGFALKAMAVKPLFARAKTGWNYVFYASLLGILTGVLGGSVLGPIVGGLIGLYIIFQVKSYYK